MTVIDDECSIISLGHKCWSRVVLEKSKVYNFKKNKTRMPFDGCVTEYECLLKLIDNDFKNVFQNLHKSNAGFHTDFQHHIHEKTESLVSFKEQMDLRVSQFYEELKFCCDNEKQIVFFLQHDNFPNKLIKILRQKFPKLKFNIFCISTKFSNTIKNLKKNKFCKFVHIPQPYLYYRHIPHGETPDGQKFDKKVIKEFLSYIKDLI
jgi:hypothetical protein